MNPGKGPVLERNGFTLIELLLAITIFVLVIGTIYASLATASTALVTGREGMELYQTSRAGLNRMVVDLRKSLSPASFPFDEEKDKQQLPGQEDFFQEDKAQLQVTFKGESNEVNFVIRQELQAEGGPTLDIREVRYHMNDGGNLVKEINRSLLVARLKELVARRAEQRMPKEQRTHERNFTNEEKGYLEKPIVQILCEGIHKVKFSYFDGEDWRDSWDSEERVISPFAREIPPEEITDQDMEKIGLPRLVKIDLFMTKSIELATCTDIPASSLNFVGDRSNESDFGSAFRSNRNRYDHGKSRGGKNEPSRPQQQRPQPRGRRR